MSKRSDSTDPELAWWKWLLWPKDRIIGAGHDPRERVEHIGHKRELSPRWALAVGMWSVKTSAEIMRAVGIDGRHDKKRGAFDVTKHRRDLWTGPDFTSHTGLAADQFTLATAIHEHIRAMRAGAAPPQLFERAAPTFPRAPTAPELVAAAAQFHVLPVEARLYYLAIEDLIADQVVPRRDEWAKRSRSSRRETWLRSWGSAEPVGLPLEVRAEIIRIARGAPPAIAMAHGTGKSLDVFRAIFGP